MNEVQKAIHRLLNNVNCEYDQRGDAHDDAILLIGALANPDTVLKTIAIVRDETRAWNEQLPDETARK